MGAVAYPFSKELNVHMIGPPLDAGPLPTVLYLCIGGQDSLESDPINQPAIALLENDALRIISVDLPYHANASEPEREPIARWADALENHTDFISSFVDHVSLLIDDLIEKKILDENHWGLMGLSRGVFLAGHVALRRKPHAFLGFAPLLRFDTLEKLTSKGKPFADQFSLLNHVDALSDNQLRFYMGNCDRKTSTKTCMNFILSLADRAHQRGVRSSPIELIIKPSIGHMGHGTAKETFEDGAAWLKSILLASSQ